MSISYPQDSLYYPNGYFLHVLYYPGGYFCGGGIIYFATPALCVTTAPLRRHTRQLWARYINDSLSCKYNRYHLVWGPVHRRMRDCTH